MGPNYHVTYNDGVVFFVIIRNKNETLGCRIEENMRMKLL